MEKRTALKSLEALSSVIFAAYVMYTGCPADRKSETISESEIAKKHRMKTVGYSNCSAAQRLVLCVH